VNCPYPGLAAGIVGVIVALAPGIVTWEEVQAAGVQRVVAVPLDRDDPGRIASRSMVVVVVLLNPAGAGMVVARLFPMFHSICLVPPGTREGCHYSYTLTVPGTRKGCHYICTIDKAYHNHNVLATRSLTKVPLIVGGGGRSFHWLEILGGATEFLLKLSMIRDCAILWSL